jgi:hypothetical protein
MKAEVEFFYDMYPLRKTEFFYQLFPRIALADAVSPVVTPMV